MDGTDVRELSLASMRAQISVVFQESFLFNLSVRDNIRLGKLDATDDEVVAAAKLAEMHEIVMALPSGYDTVLGEGGTRLSGGQRQRIAIARALIRQPSILLLDEATSALDARTEEAINETLKRACRSRTVLAVTHRFGWAEDADLIYALDGGRVVERGTHAELLARRGLYRRLWEHAQGFVVNERGRIVGIAPSRIATIGIFRGLPAEHLETLAGEFMIDRRTAGDIVFEEGDLADKFYVVGRGQVDVEAMGPTGARRRLARLRDGDHFGEIGLLMNRRRTASVTVTAPTELLVLEGARFDELMRALPELRDSLTARMPR
jgi:ATP-binding cassette subfamily B protein